MAIGQVQPGATLGELMLGIAITANLAALVDDAGADIAPRLPSEPSRLALLRDAAVQGYQGFIIGYPLWNWTKPWVTINCDPTGASALCVQGDAGRYLLPRGIASRPLTSWVLTNPSAPSQSGRVIDTSAARVAAGWARDVQTTQPLISACRPMITADGSVQWELIVSPRPDQAYTLEAQCRLQPPPLVDLTDRHLAGPSHDRTIRLLGEAELFSRDPDKAGPAAERAQASLLASVELDKQLIERTLGKVRDSGLDDEPLTRADVRRLSDPDIVYGAVV